MKRICFGWTVIGASALLLAAHQSRAEYSVRALAATTFASTDSGTLRNSVPSVSREQSETSNAGNMAFARTTASLGHLSGLARVTSPLITPSDRYTSAITSAQFSDSVTILSGGQTVLLQFTLDLDADLFANDVLRTGAEGTASFQATHSGGVLTGSAILRRDARGLNTGNRQFSFTVQDGWKVDLQGSLQLSAAIDAGRNGLIAEADFENTARFFIDSQTPGVTFVSDSGHDYSSAAVPEPGATVLLTAGILPLKSLRRRARVASPA
jgi:hypothetical protein